MLDTQLNLLEILSELPIFEKDKAAAIWDQLLNLSKDNTSVFEHRNIRSTIGQDNKFADCTAITI